MGWAIAAFLMVLALAIAVHHVGVRGLWKEAPAILVLAPAVILLGAWLVLIWSASRAIGLLAIPAAVVAAVPLVLLARAAMRVISRSRADRLGLVDRSTINSMADSTAAEVAVILIAGVVTAVVLIVLLVIEAVNGG
jgi:hypothetical protein